MKKEDIWKDITDYTDFLRKTGWQISFSCFDFGFKSFVPKLPEYEVHLPPICTYLKANQHTQGKCLCNKRLFVAGCPSKPLYGCCYAGVEEFVLPVLLEGVTLLTIHISGFRGRLPKAARLAELTAGYCDQRFWEMYRDLSENAPSMELALSMAKPFFYMFRELFACYLDSEQVIACSERLYLSAVSYVYDNYMNSITCQDVARAISCSESYLRRIFKEKSGRTLNRFVNEVRLSKAEALLRNTDLSITSVAADTGFSDANYFSTVFKRHFGVPPKKYQNLC